MTKSVFQALMDSAYDRYNSNRPELWKKDAILEQAVGDEVLAVALGNWNYQVENGGFSQWIGNEYSTELAVSAIKIALRMIGTDSARMALGLIQKAESVGLSEPHYSYAEPEIDYDDWRDHLSTLDQQYYEINESLMDDAERFFASRVRPEL